MYPVYTTFENLAKYHLGKKLSRFLWTIYFFAWCDFLQILYIDYEHKLIENHDLYLD